MTLSKTNEIARSGRHRLALILTLLSLLGIVVSHHNLMPEDAHGMEMAAICLAVLGGAVGLVLFTGLINRRPRPVRNLSPFTALIAMPVITAPARAGPELLTVVLRR